MGRAAGAAASTNATTPAGGGAASAAGRLTLRLIGCTASLSSVYCGTLDEPLSQLEKNLDTSRRRIIRPVDAVPPAPGARLKPLTLHTALEQLPENDEGPIVRQFVGRVNRRGSCSVRLDLQLRALEAP